MSGDTHEKMLLAVGQDEASLDAARVGLALARTIGMEAALFHCEDLPPSELLKMKAAGTGEIELLRKQARDEIAPVIAALGEPDIATVVRLGVVGAEAAAATVPEENVALVVVGHRTKGVVQRLFLGRVSEEILRAVTVPVLIVPPGSEVISGPRKVLVATDLTPGSRAAFEPARRLAAGGELMLLHARDGKADASLLESWARELGGRAVMEEGEPTAVIPEVAAREGAQAVVIAMHRREGLDRWLSRSVTKVLLETQKVPLLVVRRNEV